MRRTSTSRAKLTLAAAVAFTLAAPAVADDRDDRIRELERVVREQAAEQSRLRQEMDALKREGTDGAVDRSALRAAVEDLLRDEPDLAGRFRGGSLLGGAAESRLDIGGYFSTQFRNSELPGKYASFTDMRFVLQLHAQVSRAVRFDGELEFEHGGVSDETDGEVKVEYAQILLGDSECFSLKAGSLLVPWGRFNSQHDDPLNDLVSRPTVSRFVNGVVFAAPGIGVEGVIAGSDDVSYSYDVILTNGLSDDFSSDDGIRDSRTLWEDDDNHNKTAFGRFGVVPTLEFVDALDVGTSFAWGSLGEDGDDAMRGYGFDLAARSGPLEFKGEWSHLGADRDDAAPPTDAAGNPGPIRGMAGWYAQALYRVREPWVRGLPFADESASVAFIVRRDDVNLNDRVRGAAPEDDERAWTLGVNYRPSTKTVIKLEYRFADSPFPGPEGSDRDLLSLEFATYF